MPAQYQPRILCPAGSVAGNGPAGPVAPVAPVAPGRPCGPRAPAGIWPRLKSARSNEKFLTFNEFTAFLFNCGVPTLFLGRVTAA